MTSGNSRVMMCNKNSLSIILLKYFIWHHQTNNISKWCMCGCLCFFPFQTSPVNELQVLSDDCRYLVLLAKIQSKVDKKEEALLSLERVSASCFCTAWGSFYQILHRINFMFENSHQSSRPWTQIQTADSFCLRPTVVLYTVGLFCNV